MGLNPDPLKDFKAEILGATLRRYITNNANPSEHLYNKIKTFKEYADEKSGFDLFGNKQEINDSLFVTHLYVDVADTRTDIGFLLKVSDTMQQLESKKIGLSDINDRNIRAYIEKLPKQKSEIKQRTIDFIDNYTKLKTFQELPQDKQQAILKLKEIKPSMMPETPSELKGEQNIINHFANKQDKASREFYLKLLNDTKENADIILSTEGKQGEDRKAYIKAYQHKATHDLYYFLVTQDNDKIKITSFPITEIKRVVKQIINSKGLYNNSPHSH